MKRNKYAREDENRSRERKKGLLKIVNKASSY